MNNILIDFFCANPRQTYRKGQIILHPETSVQPYLYYLEKGYVRVYTLLSNGTEKTYVFYKAGEIFPIIWAFNNLNKWLFYQAVGDATVYRVSRQKFMDFISNKPDVLLDVIHRIIDIHNIYVDRIDNLEYTNSCARVISCLLFLAKRFGKEQNNTVNIQIPLTHNDIATSIAMTRETASREIEKLIKRNLISVKIHLFVINNLKRMEEELENCIEGRCQNKIS